VGGLAKEIASGVIGGLVGAGLMKIVIPPPAITPSKEVIARRSVDAGGTVTLKPGTMYKFAVILFHGDGDAQIRLDITRGNTTVSIYGNEQAIEILAGESIEIKAVNTDTGASRNTPTIEIASLSW
jgi:hypothetical protein